MASIEKNEPSLKPFIDPQLQDDDPQVPDKYRTVPFEFTGKGGEYFKIWIVNLLLSILTLGVYSAWAKVRSKRYFYGNTLIDGDSFEYHATPMTILKGRAISVAILLLVTIAAYFSPILQGVLFFLLILITPWVICNSMRFNAKVSSFRNVRFRFVGKPLRVYLIMYGIPLIPVVIAVAVTLLSGSGMNAESLIIPAVTGLTAAYFLFPLIQQKMTSFYMDHHRYGQLAFASKLSTGHYYMTYLKLALWSLLVYGGIVLVFVATVAFLGDGEGLEGFSDPQKMATAPISLVVGFVAAFIFFGMWLKAYLQSKIRNHVFAQTKIGRLARLESTLEVARLAKIFFTNFFMIAFTLGLAYPWAKVRLEKYRLENASLTIWGDMDGVMGEATRSASSLGEELGETFDLDLDLGF